MLTQGATDEPAWVDDIETGCRFFRTDVRSPSEVINGKAWVQAFEHVLQNMPQPPRPRRTLGVSMSEGHDPRHTMQAFGVKQRNDALKAMRDAAATPGLPEPARHGIGRLLRLPSGHEVLLVCNVGTDAPSTLPAKFRDMPLEALSFVAVGARCPHGGACLNEGELKDVEDLAAPGRRAFVRCSQHNMQFDLQTGEGVGNYLKLERFPVKVLHGAVYVGIPVAGPQVVPGGNSSVAAAAPVEGPPAGTMDVDMEGCDGCAAPVQPSEQHIPDKALAGEMPPPPVPAFSSSALHEIAAAAAEAASGVRWRSRSPRTLRKQQTAF